MNTRFERPASALALTALLLAGGIANAQSAGSYELLLSPFSLDKLTADPPAAAAIEDDAKPAFICLRAGGTTSTDRAGKLVGQPNAADCLGQRAIGKAKTQLVVTQVLVAKDGNCSDLKGFGVEVKEDKRETVVAAGLKELFKAVSPTLSTMNANALPPAWCTKSERFATTLDRSTLTVSAKTRDTPPVAVATTSVQTGPTEHLFITGDLLVKGAKELKWDNATKTLSAREKADSLYVGINWMKGDVLSRQDAASMDRLVFKLSFLPTRKPFDSFGVGIGYRLSESVFTLDANQAKDGGVMLFAGHFWTKSDALDAAGQPINGGKREKSWRLGISYSFDTLLGTLKK
jgi:hypothetical protein